MKLNETNVVQILKLSKSLSLKNIESICFDYINECITLKNVCFYYYLSQILKVKKLKKVTLRCIEQCFEQVVQTEEYLHLEYHHVIKIFKSSQLNVSSELGLLNAIEKWIKYKNEQRIIFAMKLLTTIRLHLLPIVSLKELTQSANFFSQFHAFKAAVEKTIGNKQLNPNQFGVYTEHRFCSHACYSILSIGGSFNNNIGTNVFKLSGKKFSNLTELPYLEKSQASCHAVNVNGTIYVLGGISDDCGDNVVQKFTPGVSEKWEIAGCIPKYQHGYNVCSFHDKIYVLGGNTNEHDRGHCICFNPVTGETRDLPHMLDERQFAGCAAIGNRIFIFGGVNYEGLELRRSEVFDPDLDQWNRIPDMNKCRRGHQAAAFKNKIFIMGSNARKFDGEIFDVLNNLYTHLSYAPIPNRLVFSYVRFVLIEEKIVVISRNIGRICVYDIVHNKWSTINSSISNKIFRYCSFIKVPTLN